MIQSEENMPYAVRQLAEYAESLISDTNWMDLTDMWRLLDKVQYQLFSGEMMKLDWRAFYD
jgi:hypothetical protein